MKNKFLEQLFFLEITNSCNFNCPGCNIKKIREKKQLISNQDLIFLNKILLDYYNYLKKYYNSLTISIVLGPGDYFGMFSVNEIKNHIKIFNSNFRIILGGNFSLQDEEEKIKQLVELKKDGYKFELLIVFNPLLTKDNEEILKKNIYNIKKYLSPLTNVVINFSKEIFDLEPKFILDKYKSLNFSVLFINFNPNKFLLTYKKESFDVDIIKETNWYLDFYNLLKKYNINIKNINYFETLISLLKTPDIELEKKQLIPYEFLIDNKLNIYLVKDNMGEFLYNKLNNFNELDNLKKNQKALTEIFNYKNKNFKKILYNEKLISLKNFECKNCKYRNVCLNLSTFSQIKILNELNIDNFIKKGNKIYCKGYKELIKEVERTLDEK